MNRRQLFKSLAIVGIAGLFPKSIHRIFWRDQRAYQTFYYQTPKVDPAYSSGQMRDAIARIYYIERYPKETMAEFEMRRAWATIEAAS